MRIKLAAYCAIEDRTELLRQWDAERNAPLTPETITYGSRQKVWWRCDQGHSWQTAVYSRTTGGSGCPYCIRKKPRRLGSSDLASQRPDIAAQWHPSKNGGLTPRDVAPGSHRKVWWQCEKGHVWQAEVKARTKGCGCPVCANRVLLPGENDLGTLAPELARQWHPEKNGDLTPHDILKGSHCKVWWRCEKGHEWSATINSRLNGNGCPVCAGRMVVPGENDLATAFPEVAAQWHPDKNGCLTPQQVTASSNCKVWWQCEKGHDYQAQIGARTGRNRGCPYCAGTKVLAGFNDLATVEPKVAEQWHPTLNKDLTPRQVTRGCRRYAWWQCPYGHVWKALISSRAGSQKSGCPVCAGRTRAVRRYAEILDSIAANAPENNVL